MGGFGTACQIGCYFHVAWQKVQSGRRASFFFSLFSLHLVDLLFLKALAIQESLYCCPQLLLDHLYLLKIKLFSQSRLTAGTCGLFLPGQEKIVVHCSKGVQHLCLGFVFFFTKNRDFACSKDI